MKTRAFVLIAVLILVVLICIYSPLYADRGSIPFEPDVQIFEPNQRAMIAWNGYEEILLLTTDLYASESTKVLEVLPLPSEPVVTKGDIEVFEKATELINKHLQRQASLSRSRSKSKGKGEAPAIEPAGEITFYEKIGAHGISVAHVLNSQGFIEWVDNYLKSAGVENPQIPEELKTVISEYLEEGFGWFVFDVVQLDSKPKTNEAIQYRFSTSFLYYPLKITRTEEGYTSIDLLILTLKPRYKYVFTGIPSSRVDFLHEPIPLSASELLYLNWEMDGLFRLPSNYKSWLRVWQVRGELSSFEKDLIVMDLEKMEELMVEPFTAVEESDTETVKSLLDSGVYEDVIDIGDRKTALIAAVNQGHVEIVKFLLDEGANVNARDDNGLTVLMRAVRRGNTEVVQLLVDAGADVNARNNYDNTALIEAAWGGSTEIVLILIQEDANANATDKYGRTALKYARIKGYDEIVKLLIEAGAIN